MQVTQPLSLCQPRPTAAQGKPPALHKGWVHPLQLFTSQQSAAGKGSPQALQQAQGLLQVAEHLETLRILALTGADRAVHQKSGDSGARHRAVVAAHACV